MTVKVMVVDDHEVMRDSFHLLFDEMPGFEVVGDVANADYADVMAQRLRPDLVMMDVCTESGASGLSAAARLRQRFPAMKIIVMSGFDEISYAPRAREYGANGFIHKAESQETFIEAVTAVMAGESRFPESKQLPLPQGAAPFTPREMEVLRLLCAHKTRREIADELFISEMTVKRHVSNMLQKSGFADSVELAFHMITNGWINPKY